MIHKPDLMFRSKSNDSRDPLQSPNLNQMICDMCSEIPIWTKRFTNLLRSSHLIQVIISDLDFGALSQILKLKLALKFLY